MERATLLSSETLIGPETLEQLCLPLSKPAAPATTMAAADAKLADEATQLRQTLQRTAGNVARAARLIGISRGALRHRMARYGIAQSSRAGTVVVPSRQSSAERAEATAARQDADRVMPLRKESPAPASSWEQAPQRAVQAALALRRLVAEAAEGRSPPELRMAVHWGQVLVDIEASDPGAHLLPVGDTLARPWRLLGYAEPGEIVAASAMGRVVEGWCELREREQLLGMGPPDQIGAYTVVGIRPLGSPLAMHRQRPLSRFMGRARKLALLEDLLGQAREGRGQVVGIVGEPGVGKSRLCYEFMRAHPTQGWLILATSADAYGQATPDLPVIDLLKPYFQITSRDDMLMVRDKVTAKLRTLGQFIESSQPAFLTLLNVPVEDAAWQALDPPQRRQRITDAIKRLLIRESQVQPILLVIENLHWIDGETQALLDTLVEGLATVHLLLLVTYRPEYHHGWGSKTYYTQLRLDALPRVHAEALLDSLLGDDANLAPLRKNLWQQTEGNPFFLEESVQTLVETQVLVGARGAYRLAKPMQSVQVPATVQAVLAARIDRLTPQ
jgi:hypothetical protein